MATLAVMAAHHLGILGRSGVGQSGILWPSCQPKKSRKFKALSNLPYLAIIF
jgi:hypothetical protein